MHLAGNHIGAAGRFMGEVLYFARAPFISGAERALMSQLRHLDRAKVQPVLVLGCESALIDEARAMDVPVHVVPLVKRDAENLVRWWRSLRQLRRLIHKHRPILLHANDVPSCQAMSVLGEAHRIPRVLHLRWSANAPDAAWWARRGVECVLCVSDWIRAQLGNRSGTPLVNARVEVLHDAVDWPAGNRDTLPIKRRGAVLAIGFGGQLIEEKGLDLVIEAMSRLPADRRPKLLVAGRDTRCGGAYQRYLEQHAWRAGVSNSVHWLGFLGDMADLYGQVDVIACPSRVEPLGLVPLEAARFGVPTIASQVGGLIETVVAGRTGWLAPPTAEAWAKALECVYDAAAVRQAGLAAYQRVRALYHPVRYQQRLMRVYEDLIRARGAKRVARTVDQ